MHEKKDSEKMQFSKRQNTWAVIRNSCWLGYGCVLKWWYPTTMGFPTKNDHFGVFWGYHHLRKHPYIPGDHTFPCFLGNSKKPLDYGFLRSNKHNGMSRMGFDSTKLGQACWYRVIGTCFYFFLKSFTIEVYIYILLTQIMNPPLIRHYLEMVYS